jgi:hypothetical protein
MKTVKRTLAVTAVLAFTYCFALVPVAYALGISTTVFDSFSGTSGFAYPLTLGLGIVAFVGWGLSLVKISRLKKIMCENGINKHFQIATGIALSQDYFNDDEELLNTIAKSAKHAKSSFPEISPERESDTAETGFAAFVSSSPAEWETLASVMPTERHRDTPRTSTTTPISLMGLKVAALPFI